MAVVGLVGAASSIGLFADGAYFFLQELRRQGLFIANPERPFVTAVTQGPVLLALRLGVRDLGVLALLHTAGLVLPPTGAWLAALWLQRRSDLFWMFTLMWIVVYPVSGLFAVGEYNLTYALTALAASLLFAYMDRPSAGYLAAALVVGLVLLRSYESMFFLGPVLALVTLLIVRVSRPRSFQRGLLVLVGAVFSASAVWALLSAIDPANPGQTAGLANPRTLLSNPRFVLAGVATAGVILVLRLGPGRPARIVTLVCAVVMPVALAIPMLAAGPRSYYPPRLGVGVLLFLVLVMAAYLRFGKPLRRGTPAPWAIPTVVAAVLGLNFIATSVGFGHWVGDFRSEVRSTSGLIPFEDTGLSERYASAWTNPSLSTVLQSAPGQGVVLNPDSLYYGWQPFPPRRAPLIPSDFHY